jgi:hypothetical protein
MITSFNGKDSRVMDTRFLLAYLIKLSPFRGTTILQSLHSDFIEDQICSGLRKQLLSRGSFYSILVRRLLGYNGERVGNLPRHLSRNLSPSRNFFQTPMSYCFCRLKDQLIKGFEDTYLKKKINVRYLDAHFKCVLSDFAKISKLKIIDIIAVLNSFKQRKISFWMYSKEWSFSFSEETSINFGVSEIELTINSSIITEIMLSLYKLLRPDDSYPRKKATDPRKKANDLAQEDIIGLMCLEVFKHESFMVHPICLGGLQISIDKPYEYWHERLRWDKREHLLKECAQRFIKQPYFSKKDSSYYFSVPESFCDFFIQLNHLRSRCHKDNDTLKSLDLFKLLF